MVSSQIEALVGPAEPCPSERRGGNASGEHSATPRLQFELAPGANLVAVVTRLSGAVPPSSPMPVQRLDARPGVLRFGFASGRELEVTWLGARLSADWL